MVKIEVQKWTRLLIHTHTTQTQEDKLAGVMNTNMENEEAAEQKEAVLTL